MAVHVHRPRGFTGAPTRSPRHLAPAPVLPVSAVPAPVLPVSAVPKARAPEFKAHGLAVWVAPQEGQEIDDVVLARAAALILGRALRIAPAAEIHWPATGAVSSGAVSSVAVAHADDDGVAVSSADVTHDDGAPPAPPSRGPVSHLAVDLAANEVLLGGKRVALSGFEFKLLRYLVENRSRAISREELRLFLESFDSPAAAARSIDVYVGRVRRKLRRARHCIATVRNGGYQFLPGPTATIRGPAEYCI